MSQDGSNDEVAELMGVVVTVDEVEAMPSSIPTTINTRKNEDF